MNDLIVTDLIPHPFWEFSLRLYSLPSTEFACLSLQDRLNLNVNVLLFCCWLGVSGRGHLERPELLTALANIATWHRQITEELRRLRKKIKTLPAVYQLIRDDLFCNELAAEHTEQLMLADSLPKAPINTRTSLQKLNSTIGNVWVYLHTLQVILTDEDEQALTTIIANALPQFAQPEVRRLFSHAPKV